MNRRELTGGLALSAAAIGCPLLRTEATEEEICRDDLAIDAHTALIFSQRAPLAPAPGLRDARAVWTGVPSQPDRTVLVYFHGHNNYVTLDAAGQSRVPDWAANNEAARRGASGKKAAPLTYGLDRLDSTVPERKPVVLVPEVSRLATGSFWAIEPRGQYTDEQRLGALVHDSLEHLTCLRRPGDGVYLRQNFAPPPGSRDSHRGPRHGLRRVYLSGHSGAGLPLEEAAVSALISPVRGVPADLWLFDCTYWSQVTGFVKFCERWHGAGRLAGGKRDAARFVCVYRPKTQTEEVADALRRQLAQFLAVPADSLIRDHTRDNWEGVMHAALEQSGVLFVRTYLPHDEIPTYFIPRLIRSASV